MKVLDHEILPLREVAILTNRSLGTVSTRAWRLKVGLPAVKFSGRVLGIREADLRKVLKREKAG